MSELDFDELDKAVNNLMSGVPKVEPPKNDDIKTLDINSTLPDTSRPSLDQLNSALTSVNGPAKTDSVAASALSPVTAAPAPLATRRSGRFMDVVHPSSDMKNVPKPTASRQGATIEPAAKNFEPTTAPVKEVEDIPTPDHSETESVSVVDNQSPSHQQNEWPDPLEMSGYQPEADTTSESEKTEQVATMPTEESDDEDDTVFSLDDLEDTTPEPLTSPFITDAKVEKRPLGGPTSDVVPEPVVSTAAAENDDTITNDDPNDQLPATAADVAPILPPELQKDLMAIETDGDTSAHEAEPTPEVTPTESESKAEVSAPEEEKKQPEVEKPASEIPVPTGPTSIPQQYKEEPSTSDQTNGGIYDTNNYHQPLAHPVKKKSGWLWIVWIVLLLIIGGGGAAVLYLFHII
ncbi:MAG TPA: hypothetical protein VF281_02020 [Candidatus Saccharimonadales bacterium]